MRRAAPLFAVALVILGAAFVPARAFAQNKGDLPEKERSAKAREAYDAGKRAYNLGDFDQAIKLWKGGYEFKDDPIFLFNIAQAYRQVKDFQKAIFYYKGYLRERPNAENHADVEAKIAELQKMLDAQQNAVEGPPKGTVGPGTEGKGVATQGQQGKGPEGGPHGKGGAVVPVEHPPEDTGPPPPPGRKLKLAGIVSMGAGGALFVTGIIFAIRASGIASDLEAATRSGQPWSQELSDKESSGKTSATIGAVTITLGLAGIIGGGVLYYLGMRKDASVVEQTALRHVVPQVGPNMAGVLVHFDF